LYSAIFTTIPSLLYILVAATLLLFSSINNDDPWSTSLSLSIYGVLIVNGLLHYRVNYDQNKAIQRKFKSWIRNIEKNNEKIECTRILEYGSTEKIPFYDISVGDIVCRDENLAFILDYISDRNFIQKNKIRIDESVMSFLTRSLGQKQIKPPICDTVTSALQKFDMLFVPIITITGVIGLFIAYIFAEPEEDYANQRFDIGVCVLVIIPLLRLSLPLYTIFNIFCDNLMIMYMLSPHKSISTLVSLISWKDLMIDCGWYNMALRLSHVTGVCAIDRKGILATSEPVLEKIFFVTSTGGEGSTEVLHVSSDIGGDNINAFSFDHVLWHRFISSICPLVESIRVNGCTKEKGNTNCLCAIRQLIPTHIPCGSEDAQNPSLNAFKLFNTIGDKFESSSRVQCSIVSDGDISRVHLRGSPSLLLPVCDTYWNGKTVTTMTDKVIGFASQFASRHSITSHCVAISCGTVPNLLISSPLNANCEWKKRESKTNRMQSSISEFDLSHEISINKIPQTLLALTASQEQALPSIFEMIESLQASCIRFILFSNDLELPSRIIGEKLGLEAGWNCHISLKNQGNKRRVTTLNSEGRRSSCPDGTSLHSIVSPLPPPPPNMARLPTGVQQIRPHLEEVDNVPLLVSLFTDCTVDTTREMIDILHEYRESELILGSVLSKDNLVTLMKGVFSIGVYPLYVSACSLKSTRMEREIGIASIAADLVIHQSQISFLPQILTFSRQRASLFNESLVFYFISSISLSLHYLISLILLLPFPTSPFNTILLTFIIHPLLTLSISTYNDWTPRVAISSSLSTLSHPTSTTIFFLYHFPHLITLSLTHYVMLTLSGHLPCLLPLVCQSILPFNSGASINQIECLISFLRIVSLFLSSIPHIFPYENSYKRLALFNPIWTIVVVFSLSLQVYYSSIGTFTAVSSSIFVFYTILSSISIVMAQSYKKAHARIFRKENRRRKFQFDTKLGMNSPY
ncbi:hypothetical protein PENTCL1PPCAC_22806, partial [Pristionchus entomophagus]